MFVVNVAVSTWLCVALNSSSELDLSTEVLPEEFLSEYIQEGTYRTLIFIQDELELNNYFWYRVTPMAHHSYLTFVAYLHKIGENSVRNK